MGIEPEGITDSRNGGRSIVHVKGVLTVVLLALAASEGVVLRRSYRRTIRKQVMQLRTANFPRARRQAKRAERRLKTIAGTLLRDVQRKLTPERLVIHEETFGTMTQILTQGRGGPDHIYSLHELQAYSIGKDKDRAKYEFGTKVTLAIDPVSGEIVADRMLPS